MIQAPCREDRGKRECQRDPLCWPRHGLHWPCHHLRRDRRQGVPDAGAEADRAQPSRMRRVLCSAQVMIMITRLGVDRVKPWN